MRILILNWRDIKNPLSGGAEVLTHELSKRLVARGHKVTIFSSYFKGAKKEETIDGVNIVREGHPDARTFFSSVHFKVFIQYFRKYRGNIDLIVDEFHGNPFFSPLYMKEKKVALICEVADNLWDIAVTFPFNVFGKLMEKSLPFFYRNIPIVAISQSTKTDLKSLGFKSEQIKVISLGSNSRIVSALPKKELNLTLVFLSRLSKSKGVGDAIKCVAFLKKDFPNIVLWIIGRGDEEYKIELKKQVKKLKIENNIMFFDFVSEEKKEDLLTRAHILLMPSVKEGWGLTIHEAGARATPAIVYDVPGLAEVVKNNVNGIVCKNNSPEELAKNVKTLLKNRELYEKLQKGAIEERKRHSWDETTNQFLDFIK